MINDYFLYLLIIKTSLLSKNSFSSAIKGRMNETKIAKKKKMKHLKILKKISRDIFTTFP